MTLGKVQSCTLETIRNAELLDSLRSLKRKVRVERPTANIETIMSYDIAAYPGEDGVWHDDLEYSKEEIGQRQRAYERRSDLLT